MAGRHKSDCLPMLLLLRDVEQTDGRGGCVVRHTAVMFVLALGGSGGGGISLRGGSIH
jgi:hypothetical protein